MSTENQFASVMLSRVRLARDYADLPFDLTEKPDLREVLITRTWNAMTLSGLKGYELVRMGELSENERNVLAESHRISHQFLKRTETGAAFLDEKQVVSVMMMEDDHLRIQAVLPGMNLQGAAAACFEVDDALSRHVEFAFDHQMGYLTACPAHAGTGMRASLMMHLPMLTHYKQMGNVGQTVARVGLSIRGVYGEGTEALGNIYMIGNQATLGRSEEDILSTVKAVGRQLEEMEQVYRNKAMAQNHLLVEDQVFRALGLLTGSRLMSLSEFFRLWSSLRMGIVQGIVPMQTDVIDALLTQVQNAHLRAYLETDMDGEQLNFYRSTRLRQLLREAVIRKK